MSLTVKAHFNNQIRRVNIEETKASHYEYMEAKIRAAFQVIPSETYLKLQWKDTDGDLITFSSDEELLEALGFVDNGVFRVFLEISDEPVYLLAKSSKSGRLSKTSGTGPLDKKGSKGGKGKQPMSLSWSEPLKTEEKPVEPKPDKLTGSLKRYPESIPEVSRAKAGVTAVDDERLKKMLEHIKTTALENATRIASPVAAEFAAENVVVAVEKTLLNPKEQPLKTEAELVANPEEPALPNDSVGMREDEMDSDKRLIFKEIKIVVTYLQGKVFEETAEVFGPDLSNRAAVAAADSLSMSLMQFLDRPESKSRKKVETLEVVPAVGNFDEVGPSRRPTVPLETDVEGVNMEEKNVADAIAAFQNMGFEITEDFEEDIRNAKGDIDAVFRTRKL